MLVGRPRSESKAVPGPGVESIGVAVTGVENMAAGAGGGVPGTGVTGKPARVISRIYSVHAGRVHIPSHAGVRVIFPTRPGHRSGTKGADDQSDWHTDLLLAH